MLTPVFELSQDDEFVVVIIKTPFVKVYKIIRNHNYCERSMHVGICKIYRSSKNLNLSDNIVSLQVDVTRFSPCVINLSSNKNICWGMNLLRVQGLRKFVAKSKARVNFELL